MICSLHFFITFMVQTNESLVRSFFFSGSIGIKFQRPVKRYWQIVVEVDASNKKKTYLLFLKSSRKPLVSHLLAPYRDESQDSQFVFCLFVNVSLLTVNNYVITRHFLFPALFCRYSCLSLISVKRSEMIN